MGCATTGFANPSFVDEARKQLFISVFWSFEQFTTSAVLLIVTSVAQILIDYTSAMYCLNKQREHSALSSVGK